MAHNEHRPLKSIDRHFGHPGHCCRQGPSLPELIYTNTVLSASVYPGLPQQIKYIYCHMLLIRTFPAWIFGTVNQTDTNHYDAILTFYSFFLPKDVPNANYEWTWDMQIGLDEEPNSPKSVSKTVSKTDIQRNPKCSCLNEYFCATDILLSLLPRMCSSPSNFRSFEVNLFLHFT